MQRLKNSIIFVLVLCLLVLVYVDHVTINLCDLSSIVESEAAQTVRIKVVETSWTDGSETQQGEQHQQEKNLRKEEENSADVQQRTTRVPASSSRRRPEGIVDGKLPKILLAWHDNEYWVHFTMEIGMKPDQEACYLDPVKREQPLDCEIGDDERVAHGVLFHAPTLNLKKFKWKGPYQNGWYDPRQVTFGFNIEPYYVGPTLDVFNRNFDYRTGFLWDSDVLYTYYLQKRMNTMDIFGAPIPFAEKEGAVFFANTNCRSRSKREVWVKKMMQAKGGVPVRALGPCLHNAEWPGGEKNDNHDIVHKVSVMGNYKFCIAMENSFVPDYVSEKLYHAFKTGCLPIYFGAPNVDRHLPRPRHEMFLDPRDFKTVQEFSDYLVYLNNNETAYNEYFKWKTTTREDWLPTFVKLYDYLQDTPLCRYCRLSAKSLLARQSSGLDDLVKDKPLSPIPSTEKFIF